MAANKSDLFDKEQVPEENARKFAKEIGAIFKLTSACNSVGIEELFISLGSKYLDPDYTEDDDKKPLNQAIEESIMLEQNEEKKFKSFSKNIGKSNNSNNSNNRNNFKKNDKLNNNKIKLDEKDLTDNKKKKCC